MSVRGIAVEKRTVYEFGKRKRKRTVYDARGTLAGIEYSVTGKTPAEARALAMRDVEYVRAAGFAEYAGCTVRPTAFESWEFTLPGTRCVMCYGAATLKDAVLRAANDYREHPECVQFCEIVRSIDW